MFEHPVIFACGLFFFSVYLAISRRRRFGSSFCIHTDLDGLRIFWVQCVASNIHVSWTGRTGHRQNYVALAGSVSFFGRIRRIFFDSTAFTRFSVPQKIILTERSTSSYEVIADVNSIEHSCHDDQTSLSTQEWRRCSNWTCDRISDPSARIVHITSNDNFLCVLFRTFWTDFPCISFLLFYSAGTHCARDRKPDFSDVHCLVNQCI